mgnify:CR=1 FL=1
MAAKTYSVDELAHLTGLSVSGIKKAIAEKRIKARKVGRSWAIDPSDPTVQGWLTKADVVKSPDIQALTEEINKLRRENANLAKRVRQAEAGQRRLRGKPASWRLSLRRPISPVRSRRMRRPENL